MITSKEMSFDNRYYSIMRLVIFMSCALLLIASLIKMDDLHNQLKDQSKGCPEYEQINAYILKEKQ